VLTVLSVPFRKLLWLELLSISRLFGPRTKLYTRAESNDGQNLIHTHYTYPTHGINIVQAVQYRWSSLKRWNVMVLNSLRTRKDRESRSRSYNRSMSLYRGCCRCSLGLLLDFVVVIYLGCCNLDVLLDIIIFLLCSRWPLSSHISIHVVLETHPHLTALFFSGIPAHQDK
jgi:hypothetical protein